MIKKAKKIFRVLPIHFSQIVQFIVLRLGLVSIWINNNIIHFIAHLMKILSS